MGPMHNKVLRYRNQNYEQLKKHNLELGTLFSDAAFPGVNSVLGLSNLPDNIVWKRPGDICENPRLFSDFEQSRTVRAGEFSCNWMVSACAILSGLNELKNKVIPDYWEQEWGSKYCGIFHFKFWRFGYWTDVVIDDYLPTLDNTLLVTQPGAENEFWTALLEKAYAKLHGSYEALREHDLADALVDFTGGVSELIDFSLERYSEIEDKRSQLFQLLQKETDDHSIICFTLNAESGNEIGSRTELGLVRGHCYHLTDVKRVHLAETTLRNLFNGREKVSMIRVRDPREEARKRPGSPDSALSAEGSTFAYSTETLSKLRSRNAQWQQLKDSERQRLGLTLRDSLEFWMPLEDAAWSFHECLIIRMVCKNPFAVPAERWKGSALMGRWENTPANERSGGGDIRQESFLHNPQYLMSITKELEIIIQLLQFRDADLGDTPHGQINMLIGLHIIRVEENRKCRLHKLWPHTPIVVSVDHRRKRELAYRGWLYPANYILIPTTFRQGDVLSFLIRAFSKKQQIQIRELNSDAPKSFNPCSCIFPDYEWVTVVIIESADITSKLLSKVNPYCTIACEGKKVRTDSASDDSQPVWNTAYVFYRKRPQKSIIIRVWSKNSLFPDELVGECELPAGITHSPTPLDAVLLHKASKDSDAEQVGSIHLTILTEDNLMAV